MYEGNEEDSNDDYFVCTVTHYGPGEHPWEGGGGGCGGGTGDIDDEGGPLEVGGAGCTIVKCGDARDRLAKEYLSGVWGNWPCTKFKRDHAELIGVGANGYHQYHDGFGLIIPALPNGIATVESRFNISLEYTSGYRCPVQNRKIKNSGGNTSHHIFGHAVDFRTTTGWTDALKDSIHQWGSNKANATESINYAKADGYHNHLAWNWRFN
ncbi:MAG: D-Ala-D-Ala carboxypeptidase family metallohydrolase [Gemmatimonadota bacterium]|nr:D-Ala-D-Ala carboxypeptidase family metallohydrolase [Gemmatimonadota bacterium]